MESDQIISCGWRWASQRHQWCSTHPWNCDQLLAKSLRHARLLEHNGGAICMENAQQLSQHVWGVHEVGHGLVAFLPELAALLAALLCEKILACSSRSVTCNIQTCLPSYYADIYLPRLRLYANSLLAPAPTVAPSDPYWVYWNTAHQPSPELAAPGTCDQ